MDKNLKKLSRGELLDLLVGLSEDYEDVIGELEELKQAHAAALSENDALRKRLADAPQLPRTAKVGSIAEMAMEANGYFEAVQRSADEYLRQIMALRDRLARRVGESEAGREQEARAAEQRAQEQLASAQEQASRLLAQANAQAEGIVASARSQAAEVLANANRQAHAMLSQAQRQASAQPAQVGRAGGAAYGEARGTQPLGDARQRHDDPEGLSSADTGKIAFNRGRHVRFAEGRL